MYSTGNYIPYSAINYNGKEYEKIIYIWKYVFGKEYMYIFIYLNHFAVHQEPMHCQSTILQ